jgi:hypothetical protein
MKKIIWCYFLWISGFSVLLGQEIDNIGLQISYESSGEEPEETECISLNWQNLSVKMIGGIWILGSKDGKVKIPASNEKEAHHIRSILINYNINELCSIAESSPAFSYLLSNGEAPEYEMIDENCIEISWGEVYVLTVEEESFLVGGASGVDKLVAFTDSEQALKAANAIIRYEFSYMCYAGELKKSFMYFRR